MHTVQSIYSSIVNKHPHLSAEELDDILATLEELEKRYGKDYFDQKTTLQNVLRLTGMKYQAIEGVYRGILEENTDHHDSMTQIKTNLKVVSVKADRLLAIQNSFPDYPVTHLSPEEERAVAVEICESASGKTVIKNGDSVGDLILTDPGTLYYLMPTQKEPEMTKKNRKYSALLGEFKPGFTEEDYDLFTESAQDAAKSLNLKMTDPFNVDSFFAFLVGSVNMAIKETEKINQEADTEDGGTIERTLTFLKASRDLFTSDKDQLLKKIEEKGITGRAVIVEMLKNDANSKKIVESPLVNTMGDFLVAVFALNPK